MAVVNLILSLEELSNLMFPETTNTPTQVVDSSTKNSLINKQKMENQLIGNTQKKIAHKSNNHYLIDGKLLSRNEILFEKHYQGRFDQKQWLKRAKIKI